MKKMRVAIIGQGRSGRNIHGKFFLDPMNDFMEVVAVVESDVDPAQYCKENGLSHDEVVYIGDDYGLGGNDESVYKSDFHYITIDNYMDFPKVVKPLL
jgi:hypothetical protein